MKKTPTKVKEKAKNNLADELNKVPTQSDSAELQTANEANAVQSGEDIKSEDEAAYDSLFDNWDEQAFVPQDFMIDVPVDSLESGVGYSSLFRQMHQAYVRMSPFINLRAAVRFPSKKPVPEPFTLATTKKMRKNDFRK